MWRILSLVVLLSACSPDGGPGTAPSTENNQAIKARPNILLVVADDLGYNDLGFTNNGKTHTPNIDEAVGNGVLLTAYHTYKVCSPTRASLM